MQTDTIITTLLSAAALLKEPLQNLATHSLKELYEAAVYYLRKKFGPESEATLVLDLATEKPDSTTRRAALIEEAVTADIGSDPEIIGLTKRMMALLPITEAFAAGPVQVAGNGNQVQVAGRDIVQTTRHVQRNVVTPDERHLDAAQRKTVRRLVADLAALLAREKAAPRFGAVHAMLQRRFQVASYLLIARERCDDAVAFLRQQCAIHRSRRCRGRHGQGGAKAAPVA